MTQKLLTSQLRSMVIAPIVLAAVVLSAHHSFGVVFDANKPVTLTGVVTKLEWTNPHSHLYVNVKDQAGKVVAWTLEGYPATVLARTGWKRDETVKVGDTVTAPRRPTCGKRRWQTGANCSSVHRRAQAKVPPLCADLRRK